MEIRVSCHWGGRFCLVGLLSGLGDFFTQTTSLAGPNTIPQGKSENAGGKEDPEMTGENLIKSPPSDSRMTRSSTDVLGGVELQRSGRQYESARAFSLKPASSPKNRSSTSATLATLATIAFTGDKGPLPGAQYGHERTYREIQRLAASLKVPMLKMPPESFQEGETSTLRDRW